MPVLSEEIEMDSAAGVGGDDLFVESNAQAGAGGQGEVAVFINFRIARRGLLHVGFAEIVKMFLNLEIGRTSGQMQRGCGGDGAAHIVGRDEHVVGLGPGWPASWC